MTPLVEPVDTQVTATALAGLLEITPQSTVGPLVSQETNDEGVSTVLFASAMLGYPDWNWTVSVAQLPDEEPTVLEAELLPGDGSLIAPDWVPWSDRLEDYKAAQAAIAAGELSEVDDADDDDADDDDEDADEDDDELAEDEAADLDDDDEHDDDDLGDDPDDGIDFESDEALAVSAAVYVDEQDEADAESDEHAPEPPAAV